MTADGLSNPGLLSSLPKCIIAGLRVAHTQIVSNGGLAEQTVLWQVCDVPPELVRINAA